MQYFFAKKRNLKTYMGWLLLYEPFWAIFGHFGPSFSSLVFFTLLGPKTGIFGHKTNTQDQKWVNLAIWVIHGLFRVIFDQFGDTFCGPNMAIFDIMEILAFLTI